jgi:formamidopyrimidine-DNA glycosylase
VAAALVGRRVKRVGRHGKHLWFELDRRPWPTFHFGMTGSFLLYDEPAKRPRFWRLEIVFAGGRRLAFSDPRRFGRIRLLQDPESEPPLSLLGPDPLLEPPTVRDLAPLLARRRAPLKAVLLDQSVFAGVGNWVADEILYQARLLPTRPASSLTPGEVSRLRTALLSVLRRAVAVRADSDRFPRTWLFHTRWGRRADATTARGEAIVHATVGGRTTAWVPTRQK